MDHKSVTITLDADRAIVLGELISRWEHDADKPYPWDDCFESPAEVRVLLGLLGDLESQLTAPFRSDYGEIVERARARLADGYEDMTLRA